MKKRATGLEVTIRKSNGVRVYHEKKGDGGELTMTKRAIG